MRVVPLAVGVASAVVAAAVLLPSVAATPWPIDEALADPFGFVDDTVGPPPLPVPLPEPLASNPVVDDGFCYRSSDTPGFCTPPLVDDDEVTAGDSASGEEPAAAPEPAVSVEQDPKEEEPAPAQPPHQVADSGDPGPSEPEPGMPAAEPADHVVPVPAPADVGGVNWAVLTAAIALPWAIGLKILATLVGLRRASRRGREEAGRPTAREDVLQAVAGQPGIRHSELVARIGRGNGTVEHHVRGLLAEGRLARVRGLGSTLYFPAGALGEAEARMRLALQGRTSRRMAQAIAASPGIRLGELARDLGVSGATAHYQAGKLVRAGVVREEAGSGRRLALTAEGAACLAVLPPGPVTAPVSSQRRTWVPDAAMA